MKKLFLASAGFVLAAASSASAQTEGVAEFQSTITTDQGKAIAGTSRVFVSKIGYRVDAEMDLSALARGRKEKGSAPTSYKTTMLGKVSEPDKLIMIDDKNRAYSIIDTKKLREETAGMREKETYTVQKLGADTVAGLSCQKAALTSGRGRKMEVCLTRDIAAGSQWLSAMERRQHDSGSWLKALKDNGLDGFPIRWVARTEGAQPATISMELTRFERKSVPASLFEVPAGYKQSESAFGGLTPEQQKAISDARARMTPEQRKALEDAMRRGGQAAPTPGP